MTENNLIENELWLCFLQMQASWVSHWFIMSYQALPLWREEVPQHWRPHGFSWRGILIDTINVDKSGAIWCYPLSFFTSLLLKNISSSLSLPYYYYHNSCMCMFENQQSSFIYRWKKNQVFLYCLWKTKIQRS